MNTNNQYNKRMTQKEQFSSEYLINKALERDKEIGIPDEKFNLMWEQASQKGRKTIQMRVQYYAAAAVITLLIGIAGVTMYQQTQLYMNNQYQQGMMALNKVSKYLNVGIEKMQPVTEMNKSLNQLQHITKTNKAINQLEEVKTIPSKRNE